MTLQILAPQTKNEQPRTPVLFTPERAAEIVAGWIEDPIDVWRKRQKKFDRVWRSRSASGQHASEKEELPPHMALAAGAVERVAARLEALGYTAEPTAGNASWDLLINDRLRVEVKASEYKRQSRPDRDRRQPRGRYQANVRARQLDQADLFIFVAINGSDHHFIIPREKLNGRHSLTIRCYNPADYTGCLSEFRERWDLIRPALEAARTRVE